MRKRREIEEKGLDLVPVMNLVTILIPFLLMSAQFVSLAVIDSSAPAIGEPQEVEEEPDEDKLSLSLLITDVGFTISGADKVLPKDDEVNGPQIACLDAQCASPEAYDYKELTRRLALVKDRYPDEPNVVFVPSPMTEYETLVYTMDATREDPEDKEDGKARELFPFVVLAGGAE